jgi:hypothetical protein
MLNDKNKKQLRETEAVKMRFLRTVAGYRRTYQRRGVDIRQELNIFVLRKKLNECQQHNYEHILRTSWNPQGKRRRGRPVNAWKDEIRDSKQRRILRAEEYFDREFRRKNYDFGLSKTVYSQKTSFNNYNKRMPTNRIPRKVFGYHPN